MLNEAGVACLSGTAFGQFGEGYLRFSIANSMENLDEALKRIGNWAKKNLIAAIRADKQIRISREFSRINTNRILDS